MSEVTNLINGKQLRWNMAEFYTRQVLTYLQVHLHSYTHLRHKIFSLGVFHETPRRFLNQNLDRLDEVLKSHPRTEYFRPLILNNR